MKPCLLIFALTAVAAGPVFAGERYAIDSRHSQPVFAINHLGFSTQYGRFNELRGTIELDREAGSGRIDVTIEAASIDMGADDWDEKMRGADFFNVEEFPTLIFRSETIVFENGKPVKVEGRLALLGTLQPLTLTVDHFHCGLDVSARRQKCGADVSARLNRSAYGMTKYLPFVADEVRLQLPIEAYLVAPSEGGNP